MSNINAIITGVAGYVPDYVLNNEELSRMVDTNDEWITTVQVLKSAASLQKKDSVPLIWHERQLSF